MKKLLLTGATILLLATGCDYKASPLTNQSVPTTNDAEVSQTPPNIAGWKTYKNDALNITFSYPPKYRVIDQPNELDSAPAGTVIAVITENPDGTMTSINISKERSALKVAVANHFNWFLTTMNSASFVEATPGMPQTDQPHFRFNYFTASAIDRQIVYLFPKDGPATPGDPADKVTDIITAKIEAVTTEEEMEQKLITPDYIAQTITFIK